MQVKAKRGAPFPALEIPGVLPRGNRCENSVELGIDANWEIAGFRRQHPKIQRRLFSLYAVQTFDVFFVIVAAVLGIVFVVVGEHNVVLEGSIVKEFVEIAKLIIKRVIVKRQDLVQKMA